MAEKHKSQAEKIAGGNNKKHASNSNAKSSGGNKITPKQTDDTERKIPVRFFSSAIFLILFIVFLVICLNSEGAIMKLLESVVRGLIGYVGFLVAIPGLLYLFFIHAFSGKRPVIMRSICVFVFILTCGCLSHLILNPENLSEGMAVISELYVGGAENTTGGLICGSVAILLQLLCGSVLSYIIYIFVGFFTLLGAMQITIPSIVRAVRNRPRADWEDEEQEQRQEPAAIVVNHIATKRIEYVEQRRNRAKAAEAEVEAESEADSLPVTKKETEKKLNKVDNMMRQIDIDVATPVSASQTSGSEEAGELSEEDILTPEVIVLSQPTKPAKTVKTAPAEEVPEKMPDLKLEEPIPTVTRIVKPRKVTAKEADESAAIVAQEIASVSAEPKAEYCYPPIDLLRRAEGSTSDGTTEMRENSRRLNETLSSFKIEAHIINVTRGPSVTRYEVELEKGVRLSKLTSAADDIALSLGASGVRIAAVPGKISVVGIEVPNKAVTAVSLREVIDSTEFTKAKSKSSFAVGKDIGGNCIVGNIAKLPHMLIAGTTGSGKSVCMNSIIISLLYKATPDEVKLIMVDPKMVELGIITEFPIC